jgi:hypothetical protein
LSALPPADADDAVLAASRCCNPLRAWAAERGSLFARPFLVFNVEDDGVYFVVFAQQALQWSTSFRRQISIAAVSFHWQ